MWCVRIADFTTFHCSSSLCCACNSVLRTYCAYIGIAHVHALHIHCECIVHPLYMYCVTLGTHCTIHSSSSNDCMHCMQYAQSLHYSKTHELHIANTFHCMCNTLLRAQHRDAEQWKAVKSAMIVFTLFQDPPLCPNSPVNVMIV